MFPRKIRDDIQLLGAEDWDRRLFDSLIPLPDGTSYNAYVVKGSTRTALVDTVDPRMTDVLMSQLQDIDSIDYVVSQHAEQDHSGSIPDVLMKYPAARVVASPKGKDLLIDHLAVAPERIIVVNDGETIDLGGKTMQFIHTPWVHWPETMCTYIPEERMLFTCDFFGSHIASTDMYVTDKGRVYEAAKRYYAEIMMPFRMVIKSNIAKIEKLQFDSIAPSHGSLYNEPAFIVDAYKDWIADEPKNLVVLPYVSMHGSTAKMVTHLVAALTKRGVGVQQFELSSTDLGKLAISLVDAATLVVGAPTVHVGPHPAVYNAVYLANVLRPKVRYASIISSYGWSSRTVERIVELIPNLKSEIIPPVLCRGLPRKDDYAALDGLADAIAARHVELGFIT